MTTRVEEKDGKLYVTFNGVLNTAAAQETEQALLPLLESQAKEIIFDCAKLQYISSSGLRILLSALKNSKASGSHLVLKSVNDVVMDVLNMTGFTTLFDIE